MEFKIGDPIEVLVPKAQPGAADPYTHFEWVAATVVVASERGIVGVAFADGHRKMLPGGFGLYRKSRFKR